jgi:hypothetical protein
VTEELEFGKDGKPLFIAGPHDGQARCRQILATLARSCGPDGSHFFMPADRLMSGGDLPPLDEMLADDEIEE